MRGHDGKLINPGTRAKRFATQLKNGKSNGKKLSKPRASYRMGYLSARKDNADWYNAHKK